jgi:hypothetical protein
VLLLRSAHRRCPSATIILNKVKQDFESRGLAFSFPEEKDIITNKDVLLKMMEIFSSKYPEKGYLIAVDEFLDYLGGRKAQEVKLDLGFMRELGEIINDPACAPSSACRKSCLTIPTSLCVGNAEPCQG